jgi:hypothetical protein
MALSGADLTSQRSIRSWLVRIRPFDFSQLYLKPSSDDERYKISKWISKLETIDPRKATDETGNWFVGHDIFKQWEKGEFRVMYCPGPRMFSAS